MLENIEKGLHCLCGGRDMVKIGFSRAVKCLGGERRRRYRCRECKKTFSENHLKRNFRFRHLDPALSSKILELVCAGVSNRLIARILKVSDHCVRIRSYRLGCQAFHFHFEQVYGGSLKICEPVCFDGLENFAGSQYDPNNINQVVGRDSLFVYDFNFASLNRKGYMSPWQKNRLGEIEKETKRLRVEKVIRKVNQ